MMRWVGGKKVPVGDIYLNYFTYPTLHGIYFMEVVLMDEPNQKYSYVICLKTLKKYS